ncbi:MAG: MmcQ/YjbR family DNA-binding protein [Clostridiaceae bacterium]|nr:MmcQ/YjbR family DNA-binding protein [Clostridiaceae bacterium]
MNTKDVIKHCLSKGNTYEDFPFGPEPLVIKANSEIFALISEKNGKTCISLKCDPFVAQSLRQQYPSVTPGYHLSKQNWNTVVLDGSVPDKELVWMIDHSYELAINKLPVASAANQETF